MHTPESPQHKRFLPPAEKARAMVVFQGGIGDTLLASPAMAALNETHSVHVVGMPERLALLRTAGIVDAVTAFDAADMGTLFTTPSARLQNFLQGVERAYLAMQDTDGALAAALRACGVSQVQTFPGIPPRSWRLHASQYYWECFGFRGDPPLPHLNLAGKSDGGWDVLVHPGSGSPSKNWPVAHFQALGAMMLERGWRVATSFGPAEAGAPCVGAPLPASSLFDLAANLRNALAYVGNDSGITHLAAAVGCPVLAIFRDTDPTVWAPRGDHVRVLHQTQWPAPEQVLEALIELMNRTARPGCK